MKPTNLLELAELLGGSPVDLSTAGQGSGWATDSRSVSPGDLFLAVRGDRADGHDHVREAWDRGAVAAVTEITVDGPHILVRNLPTALAAMASAYRARFEGPVIGITGSTGKTTTKEFTASAISSLGPILKTEGNRNTELTSPLLWTELEPEHRAVVVEMGMRGFGHIEHLANFSKPTIGVVTNIGSAHQEMVGSRDGIAKAKSELLRALPSTGLAVVWDDDDFLDQLTAASAAPVRRFGTGAEADCRLLAYTAATWTSSHVEGSLLGTHWSAELPAIGRHVAIDAAAAILAASCAGVDPTVAASNLAGAKLPPMRMEVREFNGATVLLDAYNASPESVLPAIEALMEGPKATARIAVIGEMKELGAAGQNGHREVGKALLAAQLDSILLYGPGTGETFEVLSHSSQTGVERAETLPEVEQFLRRKLTPGVVALVKGSRSLELEKAVPDC